VLVQPVANELGVGEFALRQVESTRHGLANVPVALILLRPGTLPGSSEKLFDGRIGQHPDHVREAPRAIYKMSVDLEMEIVFVGINEELAAFIC
jgi:hypothetical protein